MGCVFSKNAINPKHLEPRAFVFLGGACGTTVWRTDQAIPELEKRGLKYFNPQVPNNQWSPELMQAEFDAREKATCLLFVFDPSTRGIVTFVEIAYHIGTNDKQIIIVNLPGEFKTNTPDELRDIIRGKSYILELAKRKNIKIYTNISEAIQSI
jgi:hypothetical protein